MGLVPGTPVLKNKTICGLVTGIVDGNTFEISVHDNNGTGSNGEKRVEKIRIHGMNNPSVETLSGILAKLELEKMIIGHTLECEIINQDDPNQLVAMVPKKYLRSKFSFDAVQNS